MRRVQPPAWWHSLVGLIPQVEIPWLAPRVWTKPLAERWVRAIPAKCPFERAVWWGDRLVLYIPPLCPFNPVSTQLYSIRIAAQEFLAQSTDPVL
jgi:hypothetical protein